MLGNILSHSPEFADGFAINDTLPKLSSTVLTVWKKSLVFSCNGFTVFDSTGNLLFRVDNYPSDPQDEVVLMDAAGMALLTMRRKRMRLQNEWQGFLGEFRDAQKPLFVVRKTPSLLVSPKSLAEVYLYSLAKGNNKKPTSDYRVEGRYPKRSFTVLDGFNEVVAEVKPKQVRSAEINLGGDVFDLTVNPGYDQAFVMGLIIILDHIMPS